MGSINAQTVARKVSETIRKGERVYIGKIIRESGYSKQTADSPGLVTRTKSYKKSLEVEQRPLLERLKNEIDAIEKAISGKDKSKEEYKTLVASLDILIHNYQLLSGGATERQVFVMPAEVISRNVLPVSAPESIEAPKVEDVKTLGNGSVEP